LEHHPRILPDTVIDFSSPPQPYTSVLPLRNLSPWLLRAVFTRGVVREAERFHAICTLSVCVFRAQSSQEPVGGGPPRTIL
jgi:hypothetical protein